MDASTLHSMVMQVAPIVGVCVADPTDKSTWIIDFQDTATDAQKAAAVALVAGVSTNAVAVPQSVTNYQARAALINAGLFTQVDNAVQALGKASVEYQAWEYANQVYRNSPFITSMSTQLGLTSTQVDQLFVAAAQIT